MWISSEYRSGRKLFVLCTRPIAALRQGDAYMSEQWEMFSLLYMAETCGTREPLAVVSLLSSLLHHRAESMRSRVCFLKGWVREMRTLCRHELITGVRSSGASEWASPRQKTQRSERNLKERCHTHGNATGERQSRHHPQPHTSTASCRWLLEDSVDV